MLKLLLFVGPFFFAALLVGLAILSKIPVTYNLRNLLVRWPVTLLVALAFTLVVGLMTMMLAFVNGMYRLTENSGVASNVMVLTDGATDELFSNLGFGDITTIRHEPGVARDEGGESLVSWETYIVVNQPIPTRMCPYCGQMVEFDQLDRKLADHGDPPCPGSGSKTWGARPTWWRRWLGRVAPSLLATGSDRQRRFIQVRGIDDPLVSARVHNVSLHPGGVWFDPRSGVQTRAAADSDREAERVQLLRQAAASAVLPAPAPGTPAWPRAVTALRLAGREAVATSRQAIQAVIGEGLARELGPDQGKEALEVGDLFDLGDRKWVVVGVMQSSGSTFDSEVWAKRSIAGDLFGKVSYTTVVLRATSPEAARKLAEHLTADFKTPPVSAQTEPEYYEKLNTTNQQFLYAILVVVFIMAVGGVFGIMNTMFAAISQRTKDIGVMRILGFARWQVLASFFLEALILALVGGAIGLALGSLSSGWTMTSIASSGQGGGKTVVLKLIVDHRILLGGLLFSLAMGCVGGLLPALSAMRLRPLEAVR